MKDFGKYVLATIAGIFATMIIFAVLGFMCIIGIVASDGATVNAPDNSVLVLNMSGVIEEQGADDFLGSLTGGTVATTGLNDILSAIEKAKNDDHIKGIYIECGALDAGYSTLLEIRNALKDFKKSKKFVVAYGDQYLQNTYYLATVADKIYVNPSGSVDLHGIGSQTMYVKDLYAKFGINFQVIKVGTYKSATEMYTEDHMSEANREQVTTYINGLWDNVTTAICESRKIEKDTLNAYADRLTMMMTAEELKANKLVDGLLYHDQVKGEVKKLLKVDEDDDVNQLSVADMTSIKGKKQTGDEIAVYYAYGDIVDSPVQGVLNVGSSQIVGSKMSRDLEDLMNNDDVKAVVIRVNSPGGSAYASEQIWHQVTELKKKKPVVISMGDYAASGGYYISCNASWIVAQPTTLTGSIGIFGVIPEASELLNNKLNLHFDEVKTNRHSTMGSSVYSFLTRPFDAEESEMMQAYINHGYSLFRQRVVDGRKQSVDQIEKIAQGRVWLGQDALDIKLVDQLGGLDDAIAKAASLAKVKEYYTADYPGTVDWLDQLLDGEKTDNYLSGRLKAEMGEWYMPMMMLNAARQQCPIQASMPYILNIK